MGGTADLEAVDVPVVNKAQVTAMLGWVLLWVLKVLSVGSKPHGDESVVLLRLAGMG